MYAKRFERVAEAMYFYYQNPNSTVHTISLARCEDRVKAAEIFLDECQKRGFYEKYASEIDYKIFELGYRNTLYSYLQATKCPSYKFVKRMQRFLLEQVSDFDKNAYFTKYMDAENQKLAKMHAKNALLFLMYYEALQIYRKLRYGKKDK
jgi:hypothetical protein